MTYPRVCGIINYHDTEANAMGKTSYEVRKRWKDKAYCSYQVNLRYDIDKDLIDFIEHNKGTMGTTQIFREALEMYVESEKNSGV